MSAAVLLAESGAIEADTTPFSDYESEAGSQFSTESLTSSIRQHYYENGRRCHEKSAGKYHLPSDETEQNRLDLAHHLLTLLRGGDLYKAPLKKHGDPTTVLDAGTGTDIWALEFGEQHPGSQVIGVDLSPIQPSWTYPNVKFECDDLEKDWTYRLENFNYIHARTLAFSIKNWPRFVEQCFKHSAPGAFIELAEGSLNGISCDNDTYKGSALEKWSTALTHCLRKSGIDPSRITGDHLKQSLEEAGYVNVQVYPVRVP